jgi:hypothetical protein
VSRDPAEALRWLRRPYVAGNPRAAALREQLCREYPKVCEADPTPTHFEFEMSDPKLRIVIPDAPPMQMGPHPLGQAHTRYMGSGANGFTISVLVPTADRGMTPADCARSSSSEVARRFGVKADQVVTRQTNESTFVMLFPLKIDPMMQLKAFLLTGYAGTHCVEVHLSKLLRAGATTEAEVSSWMKGFQKARIEPY